MSFLPIEPMLADGLVGVRIVQQGAAIADTAYLEDGQIVDLHRVTHQGLLAGTSYEVSQNTLNRSLRERGVVLSHVLGHVVDVHRLLVADARVILAVSGRSLNLIL